MNVWKKTAAKNYRISRNGYHYIVMTNKVAGQGFSMMIQGQKKTSFIDLDGDNMVDAVRSATLWIKSRMESISA